MVWFKILFTWFLMAAIPMQGFAAASMLLCGMDMQHTHAAAPTGAPIDAHHDHAAMHNQTGGAEQSHAHAADLAPDAAPDGGHKCSICAACCNGVALVCLTHMVAVAPPAQAQLAEPFVLIHTLPAPVPDKPPRA